MLKPTIAARTKLLVTLVALFAATTTLGDVSPTTTDAAYPGDNGRIAFAIPEGANRHIWTMEPGGSDRQQVTTGVVQDFAPRWSPDGTKIAFRRNAPVPGLWTIDANGANPHFIPGTDQGVDVSWSPDGQRIAFADDGGDTQDIATIGINGDDYENITQSDNANEASPDWSPNGQRILFTRFSDLDGVDLWTMDTSGLNRQQVTMSPEVEEGVSDWSPDNSQIVYEASLPLAQRDIFLVGASGGTPENLTSDSISQSWPAFSPDSTSVVFHQQVPAQPSGFGSNTVIVVMELASGDQENISPAANSFDATPDWGIVPGSAPAPLTWADNDCSDAIDHFDALYGLKQAAEVEPALSTGSGCPALGTTISTQSFGDRIWGDINCDEVLDGADAVLILKYAARFLLTNVQDCPAIGILIS